MICFGEVPANSVLPIPFASYAGSTGASITLTGLAVTDVEIYKGTSMTQRASDAGVVLIDTDGIDIDGVTGIHGFSIDLSDNTDAGFYAVGSFYYVVVSAVTIDSQTVNFIAATFRIKAAEAIAGKPKVDVDGWLGTAASTPTVAGVPNVNAKTWNDLATVALPLVPTTAGRTLDVSAGGEAGLDWANVGTPGSTVNLSATTVNLTNTVTTYTGNTPQTGDSFARLTGTGAVTFASLTVTAGTTLSGAVSLGSTLGVTGTTTLAALTTTGTVTFNAFTVTNALTVSGATTLTGAVTASNASNNIVGVTLASGGLANVTAWTVAITGNITGNLSGSVGSVVGAVGSVAGAVGSVTGNVGGSVASIATGGIAAASFAAGAITATVIATGAIDADALAADAVAEIWGTALTESYGTDGSALTGAQLLYLTYGGILEHAIITTTKTVKKLDGSTTGATFTLDSATSPTSITRAS